MAAPDVLDVIVPLTGDPSALLADVATLAARWPGDTDARLVVVTSGHGERDLALLGRLGDEVEVVDAGPGATFGACVVSAVRRRSVVWQQGAVPSTEELRSVTQPGRRVSVQDCLALDVAQLADPVLTAALDLGSLVAMLRRRRLPRPRAGRARVSAALIVKDEQLALPRCLASVLGWVDEIVVCDTGSSDRTVEIARAFGASVVTTTWDDDFARARNIALDACRGTWVLSIDADEQLVVTDRSHLDRALDSPALGALGLLIRSVTDDSGRGGFEHEAIRLFRRAGVRWVGAVHESLRHPTTGREPSAHKLSGLHLEHDGYVAAVVGSRSKAERNLRLAEKDYEQACAGRSDRPVAKAAFELARALQMTGTDAPRQERLLREAIEAMPAHYTRLHASAVARLSAVLRADGRAAEAEQEARVAVALGPSDPTAALELALVLIALDRQGDALAELDRWEHAEPSEDEVTSRSAALADVAIPVLQARLLAHVDRRDESWSRLTAVLAAHPEQFTAWDLLVALARALHGPGWATAVAALTAGVPERLVAGLEPLPPELAQALRDLGVEPEDHSTAARWSREVAATLDGHDPAVLVLAAQALESDDPRAALEAWRRVPESSSRQVAMARCHIALDDVESALGCLDGVDPTSLDPVDALTVALLAAHAGDGSTALALLDALLDAPATGAAGDAGVLADAAALRQQLLAAVD